MSKEIFDVLKRELLYIGVLLALALAIFQIVYYKENFIVTLRFVLSLFWLFVIPGYFAMLYWHEKLGLAERIVIGIAVSAAIVGIFSYYIGLTGLNMKYHGYLLPLLIVITGFLAPYCKKEADN